MNVTGTLHSVIHYKLHASVVKNVTGTVYYVIYYKLHASVVKDRHQTYTFQWTLQIVSCPLCLNEED